MAALRGRLPGTSRTFETFFGLRKIIQPRFAFSRDNSLSVPTIGAIVWTRTSLRGKSEYRGGLGMKTTVLSRSSGQSHSPNMKSQSNLKPVRPELVEGPFMGRQTHHERTYTNSL